MGAPSRHAELKRRRRNTLTLRFQNKVPTIPTAFDRLRHLADGRMPFRERLRQLDGTQQGQKQLYRTSYGARCVQMIKELAYLQLSRLDVRKRFMAANQASSCHSRVASIGLGGGGARLQQSEFVPRMALGL